MGLVGYPDLALIVPSYSTARWSDGTPSYPGWRGLGLRSYWSRNKLFLPVESLIVSVAEASGEAAAEAERILWLYILIFGQLFQLGYFTVEPTRPLISDTLCVQFSWRRYGHWD